MKHYQHHELKWRMMYGRALAHLTIKAPCPLPITATGYLSHLTKPNRIYGEGGPVPFVLAWLDKEVTPAWTRQWEQARQLRLF